MKPLNRLNSVFLFWSLFLFSFSVNLEASPRYDGKVRIAVLDLEARGISKLEAETLSDFMRNEISRTGAVTPIGPIEIQEVLNERGFNKTGMTSIQWAREAGKLLSVDQVMKSSLGKIGNSYVIDARLFSVETGDIKKSFTRVYKGEADGLIGEIEKLAWDIVGMNRESAGNTEKSQISNRFSSVLTNYSPVTILNPTTSAIQIQTTTLSNKLFSGFGGKTGKMIGGTALSYLVIKGLITVISQSGNTKNAHRIGSPPAFPEVPPTPGI